MSGMADSMALESWPFGILGPTHFRARLNFVWVACCEGWERGSTFVARTLQPREKANIGLLWIGWPLVGLSSVWSVRSKLWHNFLRKPGSVRICENEVFFCKTWALMCSLTMEYCCKISQPSYLSCPVYVSYWDRIWVHGVLVGGITFHFSREAKKLFWGII